MIIKDYFGLKKGEIRNVRRKDLHKEFLKEILNNSVVSRLFFLGISVLVKKICVTDFTNSWGCP